MDSTNRKNAEKIEKKKLTAQKPDEDFIPYVCHYDPNTILTKNGELLQVIRITGFSGGSVISDLISLRDALRDSIKNNIETDNFAFWFSTIRRQKDITLQTDPENSFQDPFSKKFNDEWIEKNQWNKCYVNELYITVVIEGIDTSIGNFNSLIRSFSSFATKSLHKSFLQESHKKLSTVVNKILGEIEEYGAKLLGLKEWDGVIYSEPMRFFGKITNLYEERYPLLANDIASDLANHKIAFGAREIEVLGENNNNFAAIFSLKEYFEVSIRAIERVMQLPFEFMITQSFDFSSSKKDLESFVTCICSLGRVVAAAALTPTEVVAAFVVAQLAQQLKSVVQ
jgi:type IV secretion system protein VirB4